MPSKKSHLPQLWSTGSTISNGIIMVTGNFKKWRWVNLKSTSIKVSTHIAKCKMWCSWLPQWCCSGKRSYRIWHRVTDRVVPDTLKAKQSFEMLGTTTAGTKHQDPESSKCKIVIHKFTYLFVSCDDHNALSLCLFHSWLSPRTLLPHHLPDILLPLLRHITSIYDPPVSLHTKNNRNTDDIPLCGIHLLHSWNWLNGWWLLVTSWKFQTLQKVMCLAACDISLTHS